MSNLTIPLANHTESEAHLRSLAHATDAGETEPYPSPEVVEWRPGSGSEPTPPPAKSAASNTPNQEAPDPFRDAKGYSAADYRKAAAELATEGHPELAARAQAQAETVQQAEAAAQQLSFQRLWQEQAAHERASTPELQQSDSPLSLAVQEILQEAPVFQQVADGYKHAATLARARALQVEYLALQARVQTLTQENQRLARLTSIPGSPPARTSLATEVELSERDLRSLARDFDNDVAL